MNKDLIMPLCLLKYFHNRTLFQSIIIQIVCTYIVKKCIHFSQIQRAVLLHRGLLCIQYYSKKIHRNTFGLFTSNNIYFQWDQERERPGIYTMDNQIIISLQKPKLLIFEKIFTCNQPARVACYFSWEKNNFIEILFDGIYTSNCI